MRTPSSARRSLAGLLLSLLAVLGLQASAGPAAASGGCTDISSVFGSAPSVSYRYLAAQQFEISLRLRVGSSSCTGIAYRVAVSEIEGFRDIARTTRSGSGTGTVRDLGSVMTESTTERRLNVYVEPFNVRLQRSYAPVLFALTVPTSSFDTATQQSSSPTSCPTTTPYGYTKPC